MHEKRDDWRIQRALGIGLVVLAGYLALSRDHAETIAGTLLGFGILLLGLTVPKLKA